MRISYKLLVAGSAAALVAAGGSAFTASGSGVDDAYVSYDTNTVSGVTVSNVEYVVSSTDASKLSKIVFTEAEDVTTGYKRTLTVNGPTTTQIDCDASFTAADSTTGAAAYGTITCLTDANVADVTSISLTVAAI
jgi:hypothetical protein